MDNEKLIQRAKQEEKREARERLKRTSRYWPVILIATVAIGGLAFLMLDPMRGIVCTIVSFIASVIIVEHFS